MVLYARVRRQLVVRGEMVVMNEELRLQDVEPVEFREQVGRRVGSGTHGIHRDVAAPARRRFGAPGRIAGYTSAGSRHREKPARRVRPNACTRQRRSTTRAPWYVSLSWVPDLQFRRRNESLGIEAWRGCSVGSAGPLLSVSGASLTRLMFCIRTSLVASGFAKTVPGCLLLAQPYEPG